MGLFDRKKTETIELNNGVNINSVDEQRVCKPFLFNLGGRGKKNFADVIVYAVMDKIFNGLSNLRWYTTEVDYLADDILNFINNNSQLLIYHYWSDGYACIMMDKSGRLRFPYTNEIKKDANGKVTNANAVTIYSQPYQIERRSHIQLIQPLMQSINNNLNNGDFVTSNLGLFGILNGKGVPISPAAKEELQEKLKKQYGFGDDKFQFILSNTEIDYKPITIPVDQLKLNDNTDYQVKMLCRLFNLNPMLLFGESTYSNQAEATKAFYNDCIKPLAEVLLLLARNIYIAQNRTLKPSSIITYDLSNIPEFNHTLSEKCTDLSAYVDYLLKLKEAGIDVDDDLQKAYEMSKELINNV